MAIDCTLADKCAYKGHLTDPSPPSPRKCTVRVNLSLSSVLRLTWVRSTGTRRRSDRERERVGNQKHDVQHKKIFVLLSHICLHSLYICTLCTHCIGVCGCGLALQSLKPGRTDILYFIMRKRKKKQENENEKRQRRKVRWKFSTA